MQRQRSADQCEVDQPALGCDLPYRLIPVHQHIECEPQGDSGNDREKDAARSRIAQAEADDHMDVEDPMAQDRVSHADRRRCNQESVDEPPCR